MNQISKQLVQSISAKPLALFRIVFGVLMAWELIDYRFFRSEINDFFINPTFHFSYQGMGWIPTLSATAFSLFYWLLIGLFILLSIGLLYRLVSVLCFLGWSWLFFMERTIYFNHWYLAMLILFLLVFLPANQALSVDAKRSQQSDDPTIPFWCTASLALLTGIVYFFSGTAKLNPDWLIGQPLILVFQQELGHLPQLVQQLLGDRSVGLFVSYLTIILELCALPLLIWQRSRMGMVFLLIGFNLLNLLFFPVGIFPLLMIALTLLWIPVGESLDSPAQSSTESLGIPPWIKLTFTFFFVLQFLLPARRLMYSGSQLWAEEGLLFSWPMFTTYKGGDAMYLIDAGDDAPLDTIRPQHFDLTGGQYTRLVKNPDCLLQYAHHLGRLYAEKGFTNVSVYCDSWVHLNGKPLQRFVHPNVDLMQEQRRLITPYWWVLPLEGTVRAGQIRE